MRQLVRSAWVLVLMAIVGGTAAFASGEGEAAGAGATEVRLAHYFVDADTSAQAIATRAMVDTFQQTRPDINVVVDAIGHDSYEERILVLAAGNELPDVFRFRASTIGDFVAGGLLQPLDELLAATPQFADNRLPNSFRTLDGVAWGVPMNALSTSLVYYNQEIFAEVGIDRFPETWTEFEDAIVRLRDAGHIPIAMGNRAPWLGQSCYLSTIAVRYTGEAWFQSILDRDGAAFTDRPFVAALEAMQNLAEIGAFNDDFLSIDNTAMRRLYYTGRAAMFIEGSWALEQLEANAPSEVRDATGIAVLPAIAGTGAPQNTMSGGPSAWTWGISAGLSAERLQAAWDLMVAINGSESANIMAANGGVPLTRADDFDPSDLSERQLRFLEILDEYTITPIYDAHLNAALIETINNGIQELLLGSVTPEALAQTIQAHYSRL